MAMSSVTRDSTSFTSTLVSSSSSAHSDSDDSNSDSDTGSATGQLHEDEQDLNDSDDDEDDSDVETTQRMKALLLKAKESMRARESATLARQSRGTTNQGDATVDSLAGNHAEIKFGDSGSEGDSDEEDDAQTPKASTSSTQTRKGYALPPSLIKPLHLRAPTATSLLAGSVSAADSRSKGKARARDGDSPTTGTGNTAPATKTLGQDLAGIVQEDTDSTAGKTASTGDRWGRAPLPSLSKKERQARHAPTAGPKWFNMPATPLTPETKREIQAMRLRNALDPKRFYKGSATKEDKAMPEFFQIGHVVTSDNNHGKSVSTNPNGYQRDGSVRKRTFVEELVEDEQARAYTKRKTREVMERGMSGRRGGNRKGASKQRKR